MLIKQNIISLFVLLFSFNVSATIYRVTPSGSGTLTGLSWGNAAEGDSLQSIINNATTGDEIWVACGTYTPTNSTDRSLSFSMKNEVTIYGGFQGSELSLSSRDLSCGSCSILSGEIGSFGDADNSYTVVRNELLDTTAVLDGFVIRDGNDDRSPTSDGDGLGGGLYNHGFSVSGYCHPIIRNIFFINNSASWGGGAFNNGKNGGNTEPTYINCVFYQNHAYIEAGGMDSYGVAGNASPTIINTIFYGNTSATNVGAMYAWGGNSGGNSHPVLINCVFANNFATNGYGGAFIANNLDENGTTSSGSCTVTLQNCIVWGNTATGIGQQFYVRGNGAQVIATYSDIDTTSQNFPHVISGSGIGNLSLDPLFLNISNPLGTDNCWLNIDDGLQLLSNSPCIDSGNNANTAYLTDIIGNTRISEGTVDIGPYEYQNITEILVTSSDKLLKLYPNPVANWLTIENQFKVNDEVSILNYLGQKIIPNVIISGPNQHVVKINLQDVPDGIYIVKINSVPAKTIYKVTE